MTNVLLQNKTRSCFSSVNIVALNCFICIPIRYLFTKKPINISYRSKARSIIDVKKTILLLGEMGISQHQIFRPLKISPRSVRQTFTQFHTVTTKPVAAHLPKATDREKRSIQLQQLVDERGSLADLLLYVHTNFNSSIGHSMIEDSNIVSYIVPRKSRRAARQRRNRLSCCSDHLNC